MLSVARVSGRRFRPYGAKSRQAKDMPRVLRPSNLSMIKRVTFDPTLLTMFLETLLSPKKKKIINCDKCHVLAKFSIYKYDTKFFVIVTNKKVL